MLTVTSWLKMRESNPDDPVLPCSALAHLFYGPDVDGRSEPDREQRELLCKALCGSCEYRFPCLRRAVHNRENLGVQGGMGEGERRAFIQHLKAEGYEECPEDDEELYASTREFYEQHSDRYIHPLALDVAAEWEAYRVTGCEAS
jgi:hypothetical protein